MMKKLHRLKKQYKEIDIPPELETTVQSAFQQAKKPSRKRFPVKQVALIVAAMMFLFFSSIQVSPKIAQAVSKIPVLGHVVEAISIQQFSIEESTYEAKDETPQLAGLENLQLQDTLNEKYIEESQELFTQFNDEMKDLKEKGNSYLGLETIYEVKTDTEDLFSIARYEIKTQASSATTVKYDTIDKTRQALITLPSLFKDETYIDVISEYIASEMQEEMAANEMVSYFLDEDFSDHFTAIHREQNFYITANHKLVISFDQYEVAPGSMGVVTFEIPTEVIEDLLISHVYIR